jgi:hypothetical protein
MTWAPTCIMNCVTTQVLQAMNIETLGPITPLCHNLGTLEKERNLQVGAPHHESKSFW